MTTAYRSLSPEALRREYAEGSARFDALRGLGLALNMARGKPGKAQLDAVSDILTILRDPVQCQADGMDVTSLWWALSLGACLGGNGTLIGASANVIVAGIAAREGHPISFLRFLIWSVPVMLLSVAMAGVFLYLEYFI